MSLEQSIRKIIFSSFIGIGIYTLAKLAFSAYADPVAGNNRLAIIRKDKRAGEDTAIESLKCGAKIGIKMPASQALLMVTAINFTASQSQTG